MIRDCTGGLRKGIRARADTPRASGVSVSSNAVWESSTGGRIDTRETTNVPTTPMVKRRGPIRCRAKTSRMRKRYSSWASSVNVKTLWEEDFLSWTCGRGELVRTYVMLPDGPVLSSLITADVNGWPSGPMRLGVLKR